MAGPQNRWDDPDQDDLPDLSGEADLWFLPGPIEAANPAGSPLPKASQSEDGTLAAWVRAEARHAARLASAAALLGALDDRLGRGPKGWRHRLALMEAVELSWLAGDRVGKDQLSLWLSLRLARVQDDARALSRSGWAVRRLTGGLRPGAGTEGSLNLGPETDLAAFLDRFATAPDLDRDGHLESLVDGAEPLSDRVEGWTAMMAAASDLHPISRAAVGYHLWSLAGLGHRGDRLEAAVTAARLAAADSRGGAVFAPLALGGAVGLRASGTPSDRMALWYDGLANAVRAAMRHLDALEVWQASATSAIAPLSGRTPARLLQVVAEWPVVSAQMAEDATGASRAAIQRNLTWMEDKGLLREVTGQGRFRYWAARLSP